MAETKRTPLHQFHLDHGARMTPFAGWDMPLQYTGIVQEHLATRRAAGLFDVSHMGQLALRGAGTPALLDKLLTNAVGDLQPGRCRYSLMCDDGGGVVDDVILIRSRADEWLLVVNASNREVAREWIISHRENLDVELTDLTDTSCLLALQGPAAMAILELLVDHPLAGLPRFAARDVTIRGIAALVSRTGYTGEDGVEISAPAAQAVALAQTILDIGRSRGLLLVGLGARDSLRLEAGLPLYGHEIGRDIDPLTADLGRFVKLDKSPGFIGQDALRQRQHDGLSQRVAHFRMPDRRIAREGADIFHADNVVGRVLSGSYSPVIERGLGSALLPRELPPELTVQVRGQNVTIEIAKPPLHRLP